MSAPDTSAEEEVRVELERVVRRWQQLPLDRALPALPAVSALVQELADEVATARRMPLEPVPDLGPGAVPDQLTVMVYDHRQAMLDAESLAARLRALRRGLP